jgi:hypothetical protein
MIDWIDFYTIYMSGQKSLEVPCPRTLPEAGDIFRFAVDLETPGGQTYQIGDELHLMKRTSDAPYGKLSSLGNWLVITKHGISVWSNIEWLIADEKIVYIEEHDGPA